MNKLSIPALYKGFRIGTKFHTVQAGGMSLTKFNTQNIAANEAERLNYIMLKKHFDQHEQVVDRLKNELEILSETYFKLKLVNNYLNSVCKKYRGFNANLYGKKKTPKEIIRSTKNFLNKRVFYYIKRGL